MTRKGWETMAGILVISAGALGLAGCKVLGPERIGMQTVERREAGRGELLALLDEQSKLLRLSATLRISILEESSVVPATVLDAVRKEREKPYKKKFAEAEVNGSFFLSRDAEGRRNVSLSGEMEGVSGIGFTLLGKNQSFWMLIPTTQEERDKAITQGVSAPRGKVFYGTFDSEAVRPRDRYSIRPQDFADLLLMAEARRALDGKDVCYVETWPDYYVLNFLRPDWANHIYSKIWFERESLTVAIHQLFDSSGELVAEARFKGYAAYATAPGGKVKLDVASHVDFLWPRDRILMRSTFGDVKLNGIIPEKVFDEKRFEGYPAERIEVPPAR